MSANESPNQPSLPWRVASASIMGIFGGAARFALYSALNTETHGLDEFKELVEERHDIEGRQRGLITVSNHISIIDDPLIWGTLPYSYHFNPSNSRWTLGSYDLCFANKFLSTFFTCGQLLPTHRHKFSEYGGPFQPTMTEAIRLLSRFPFTSHYSSRIESSTVSSKANPSILSPDITDPFSEPHLTYSTNGFDTFPAPSSYPSRRYAWLHIFPEGFVHQHPHRTMRYFKWGVARLILEPEVCPDIIPIWIEGNEQIMHEARSFPRWIPRLGKKVGIWFGNNVGGDHGVFTEMRRRWQELVEEDRVKRKGVGNDLGVLSEDLKYGKEAVSLRMECAKRMREEVLRVRRLRGLPDEDPKQGLVETWREEGERREGKMRDGSWVKDV